MLQETSVLSAKGDSRAKRILCPFSTQFRTFDPIVVNDREGLRNGRWINLNKPL